MVGTEESCATRSQVDEKKAELYIGPQGGGTGTACHSRWGGIVGFPTCPTMFYDGYIWLTKLDLEINAI